MLAALIDTNPMQPPVAPIGLDYLAEALHAAGHAVGLLGLCREDDPGSAIARFFKSSDFNLVGMTLRNTDDCAFTSWGSFTPEFVGLVEAVRENSSAPIVLGGVGFPVMPDRNVSPRAGQHAGRNGFNCTLLHLPTYDDGPFTGHAALHTLPVGRLQELLTCVEINS